MTDGFLLDTCALIWLANGDSSLSKAAREKIADSAVLCVSPVSAWEIAVKAAKGKIGLPCPAREWFDAVAKRYDIEVLRISSDEMLAAAELPWIHRDPADRFIIATAQRRGLTVVTADTNFPKYGVETIC